MCGSHLLRLAAVGDAGIVDQDVEAAPLPKHGLGEVADLLGSRRSQGTSTTETPWRSSLAGNQRQLHGIDIDEKEMRARTGHGQSNGPADA